MPFLIRNGLVILSSYAAGYGVGSGSDKSEKTNNNIRMLKLAGVGVATFIIIKKLRKM